ncbi:hypothetical protein F4X86_01490 [Candidatus Saccharibacteria bacterium]|nr:hypothetical protein [Candidatus Saccharibacteria bacterium]
MGKIKSYTLYLAKETVDNFEILFSKNARERIDSGDVISSKSSEFGEEAIIYLFDNPIKTPSWLPDVRNIFEGVSDAKSKTTSAVIIFRQAGRIFITPFGYGWQYIDDTKVETDFGLYVVINSLDDRKVQRIDRNHLGEAIKGVSQSAFLRNLQSFGVDEALDLVRRISGRVEDENDLYTLSGAKSLKISREMVLSDLPLIAEESLERFISKDYQSTAFRIIDKVRYITDKSLVTELNENAVSKIKSGSNNFELSLPERFEEDVVYYGMQGPGYKKLLPDLLMSDYREALGNRIDSIDTATIKKHYVYAEFNNEASVIKKWSILKALVGSLVFNNKLYAINEGEWYRLDQQYKELVDDSFEKLKENWGKDPLPIQTEYSDDTKKIGYESEASYNKRCATEYNQICLDGKILEVSGMQYSRFETCDLLDLTGKRLIHVKISSRKSSVLSHFFKQGTNSAKIMKTIPEARRILIEKVHSLENKTIARRLENALGDSMEGWKIEYHIVDAPRKDNIFKIPFFSRITLLEESRNIKSMGLDVSIRFIPFPKINNGHLDT